MLYTRYCILDSPCELWAHCHNDMRHTVQCRYGPTPCSTVSTNVGMSCSLVFVHITVHAHVDSWCTLSCLYTILIPRWSSISSIQHPIMCLDRKLHFAKSGSRLVGVPVGADFWSFREVRRNSLVNSQIWSRTAYRHLKALYCTHFLGNGEKL